MAEGDYLAAFALFEPLAGSAAEPAGLAAAALASGLRQLGEHGRAVALDATAARSCGAGRVDGLIGLAADHVGLAEPVAAQQALDLAAPELADWRDRVRHGWVATELALLRRDPEEALRFAERAVATARSAGSVRHQVKSELFHAVSRRTVTRGNGAAELHEVARVADQHRLRPLQWPAVQVLGEEATAAEVEGARSALSFIAAHLPPDVGGSWGGNAAAALL